MTQRYQPEIDGLRALAIVLVVAFHTGLPLLRGGFVGVDVFFVLSGFLITRLLLDELRATGRIDLVGFYARRVRRLLPALLTVLVAALAIGSFVLSSSGERQELSRATEATATFTANFYFWRSQAVYFVLRSDWLPLLNMWTLSVEEQFYAFWPALLLLGAVFARYRRLSFHGVFAALLGVIVLGSFLVFAWGAQAKPVAAFYATPTRVWELALGGLLVLLPPPPARTASAAGLIGLALVLFAAAARGHAFAIRIIISALGASVLIWSLSISPKSALANALKYWPVVMIGRLSYSWYLWHWPLLVFARIHDAGRVDHVRDGIAVLLALVLSALTYVAIENPIRRSRPWPFASRGQTLLAGAAMSLAAIVLSFSLGMRANAELAESPALRAIHAAASGAVHARTGCHVPERFYGLAPAQDCRIGTGPVKLLLWGDSQAQQLVETVREDGAAHGYSAVSYTMSGCAPPLHSNAGPFDCADFNRAVAGQIPALVKEGMSGIVLASRAYALPHQNPTAAKRALWETNLNEFLEQANSRGLRVLFIAPLPVFRVPWPQCLAHAPAERCSDTCDHFDQVSEPVVSALRAVVARHANARLWSPWRIFCRNGTYLPLTDDEIFYSDSGHLSVEGSRRLAPLASAQFGWLAGGGSLSAASLR